MATKKPPKNQIHCETVHGKNSKAELKAHLGSCIPSELCHALAFPTVIPLSAVLTQTLSVGSEHERSHDTNNFEDDEDYDERHEDGSGSVICELFYLFCLHFSKNEFLSILIHLR